MNQKKRVYVTFDEFRQGNPEQGHSEIIGHTDDLSISVILFPEQIQMLLQQFLEAQGSYEENRYYVQNCGSIFLVRELQKPGDTPSEADPTIRAFDDREQAHLYKATMNDQQRQLDALHGRWKIHAMTPEITGEKQ